ncbi:MAG: AsnC family transcriptional regulator, partial [Nitrososphaerales archaeon]
MNKSGFEVDDIDLKIIQVLVKNARADFKDIAEIVGVSDRTVARRIERLEKNKVIRGYHVDLDREALMQQGINLPECDEYVKLSRLEWEELWNALGKIMGSGLGILLFHAGKAVGSEIGSKLLKRYIEPSTALNMLPTMLVGRGCKECRLIDLNQDKGLGK